MYLSTKNKIKNLFILLLAVTMAFSMVLATACTKDDDSGDGGSGNGNTTTETTLTDYQVLKNGDFEFMTDKDTVFPKSSSIAWSNSLDSGTNGNSAPSTSGYGKSGIIDTLEEGSNSPYSKLDNKYKPGTDAYNPHTPYYYGLVENKFVDDAEDADYEDNKTFVNAKGSKILMIQNKTSNENVLGTAQKFKSSSSLSVNADSYAVFSVWVKTVDLKSTFTDTPGAYVALDFKVGSTSYETIYFNNINTDGEWALLQAKIQGFEYASTTAYVTLGLGKGNALGKTGYVEGFAYFDNAHFEVYNKQEFDALNSTDEFITITKEDNASIDMSSKTYIKNPTEKAETPASNKDKFSTFSYNLNLRQTNVLTALDKINGEVSYNTTDKYNSDNNIATTTKIGVSTKGAMPTLTDKFDDFDKIGGTNDTSVIYFDFNNFASATYLSNEIELKSNKYNLITFYVKSNTIRLNSDKVSVDIVDYVNDTKESATAAFDSFTTQDVEEANYGGWVKYSIMVNNPTDKDAKYKVRITFGPNKNDIKNVFDAYFLQSGYALIADLQAYEISEELYNLSSADATLSKVSLKGVYGSYGQDVEEDDSDIYNTNVDGLGELEIATKPTTNLPEFTRKDCGEGVVSGIINSKYTYAGIDNETFAKLTSNDNKYAQAVVLQSNTATNSALITKAKTINENSFVKIAVKLNVSAGAVANVYVSTNKLVNDKYEVAKIAPTGENYTWAAKELKATVVGSNSDTWTEVAFYIATGNEAFEYKVEIWLGDRYEEEDTKSAGTIFMENVIVTDYDEASYLYAKYLFIDAYADDDSYEAYKHTRVPTTIKETDENGDTVTTTKYYNEREIYNGNKYTKFIDYTTLFADNEIDNMVEEDDGHDHESETEEEFAVKTDVALQISSIIIAVVLIAVMIIVLIRTIFKNRKNRKEYVSSFYDRNSREKTIKKIKEKNTTVVLDEEENVEYNYEEAEAIEEPAVIDVNELNQNPEDLQEDGGSEDSTNEETTEDSTNE